MSEYFIRGFDKSGKKIFPGTFAHSMAEAKEYARQIAYELNARHPGHNNTVLVPRYVDGTGPFGAVGKEVIVGGYILGIGGCVTISLTKPKPKPRKH